MTAPQPDELLLGVSREDCDAALAFVAADVWRYGGRVRVAHAVLPLEHTDLPAPPSAQVAAAHLEQRLPGVPVEATLLHGIASSALVGASGSARRVVVQRRRRAKGRLRTLATTGNVAAHAAVPVVVVPPEWRPDAERETQVVVGVEDVLTAPQLLTTALEETAVRGGRLRIVHAWFYSDTYDGVAFAGPALQQHEDEVRTHLTRELEPVLSRHRDVPTELVVAHGRPADVLVEASRAAGLLVLGRHEASVPWGSHLGSVARAVLRHSECPVLVLDTVAPHERHHHQFSSGNIEMAPAGHSAAQMPHPLQKSRSMT